MAEVRRHRFLWCALGLAALCAASPAVEQTWENPEAAGGTLTREQIELALQELADDDFAVRQRACELLTSRSDGRVLARLYGALAAEVAPQVRSTVSALLPGIRDKVGGEQCVQDFLYLGPFPFPEGNQPRDHQPQRDWLGLPTGLDNLARIDTDAEVPVDPEKPQGRKLKWTRPFEGKWGRVDLKKPFKRQIEFANGFMLTFVHSDAAAAARLWIGSDDGIAVWLNGKRVHALDIQRALTPDEDLVEVALKPGWNPLLVRVSQGYGGWELALRITDARGLPWPKQKIDPACGGQPRPEIPVPAPVKEEKQEVRKEAAGR